MKKFLQKLTELQRMLILSGIVSIFFMLLALIPLLVFSQPGWLIGVAIGSAIEIFNTFLLYQGSELTFKRGKPIWFLLFYFARMSLFLGGFLLTAFLGIGFAYQGVTYIVPIPAFVNSIWGVLIAYTPIQIVVIISMIIKRKSPLTIAEKEDKDK